MLDSIGQIFSAEMLHDANERVSGQRRVGILKLTVIDALLNNAGHIGYGHLGAQFQSVGPCVFGVSKLE